MRATLGFVFMGFACLAACGDGEPARDCDATTCPEGCCRDDRCVEQSDTSCGTAGAPCVDCSADPQADACAQGACVCAAAGERCEEGEICSASGCQGCQPDCAGKCDGADDGCRGVCPQNDCAGCCDGDRSCAGLAEQHAALCGAGGEDCADCSAALESDACVDGTCICQAQGAACDAGVACGPAGCCTPDCREKCAGAGDGCGGLCTSTRCTMGCCTPDRLCLDRAGLDDEFCGPVEADCVDCTAFGRVCANFACVDDAAHSAEFVTQSVPDSLDTGEQVQATVVMRNTGTDTWTQAGQYKLGAQNPQDNGRWGTSRVQLEAGERVMPGEVEIFVFQITAPATAGVYDFQWRMLQESVEWFGEYTPNLRIAVGAQDVTVCEAVRALADQDADASAAIQACIDATPAHGVLELPIGTYRIDHSIQIASDPISLRSEGRGPDAARCALDGHDCAVLEASTAFADSLAILQVLVNGSAVDHIVLDDNKTARASTASGAECAAYHNAYGYNLRLVCDDCSLTNSVTKNALCGTGCEVTGARSGVTLWRNTVAGNGVHDREGLWADGVTVHDATRSSFTENEFIDNTDIDLIFGGCTSCVIQGNTIRHSDAFSGGSFAALMLHAWPDGSGGNGTSGDFSGTHTSGNQIDCGAQRRCGIGLYLGSDAWYITDVFGGSVHDNSIQNAEFGLLIDDVHDMEVYDNPVANPASSTQTSCGPKTAHDYGIGDRSFNVDTSSDSLGSVYFDVDYDGCIPNWWNP
ncbi:MAG: hypothetical protein JXR96_23800 [Deltaproteobacteria bacterium]|nr:hypothetical protein [Deltaproteobacteria bacterium]